MIFYALDKHLKQKLTLAVKNIIDYSGSSLFIKFVIFLNSVSSNYFDARLSAIIII